MYLTRCEYNDLVQTFPHWMRTEWLGLRREWSAGGVRVSGEGEAMEALRFLLTLLTVQFAPNLPN